MYITCMPKTAYNLAVAIIRDYPRQVDEIKSYNRKPEGKRTEDDAMSYQNAQDCVRRVEKCISDTIPSYMVKGIVDHIAHKARYPIHSYEQHTWEIINQKFILSVAREFGIYVRNKK